MKRKLINYCNDFTLRTTQNLSALDRLIESEERLNAVVARRINLSIPL